MSYYFNDQFIWQGFDNEELNRELLAKYAGNYDEVAAELSKAGLL